MTNEEKYNKGLISRWQLMKREKEERRRYSNSDDFTVWLGRVVIKLVGYALLLFVIYCIAVGLDGQTTVIRW